MAKGKSNFQAFLDFLSDNMILIIIFGAPLIYGLLQFLAFVITGKTFDIK